MAAACPTSTPSSAATRVRALEEVLTAIRDATADGRHEEYAPTVHLPVAPEPGATTGVAVEAVAGTAPRSDRDMFPTGRIVAGRMSG